MSSPWSRAGSPSVTLPSPPAPPSTQAAPTPFPDGFPPGQKPRSRFSGRAVLGLLTAIIVSAVITATVTYLVTRDNSPEHSTSAAPPASGPTAPSAAPASPQPSPPADAAAAKAHLCEVFDTSVRGQEAQGGLRVEGNLNLPLILRGVNSATAIQNALTPSVPPEIAGLAHKYISATLDQTTAAMGNTPTPEVNRLTDIRNSATYELADACGVPR